MGPFCVDWAALEANVKWTLVAKWASSYQPSQSIVTYPFSYNITGNLAAVR